MSGLAIIVFGTWLIISFLTFSPEYKSKLHHIYNEPRTKTNWNAISLILNLYERGWKPKNKIQRDIERERKKIAKEEREIESMEELEQLIHSRKALEKKKESLFKDVHRDERQDDQEEYHCYTCNKVIIGLDKFYKHRRKEHTQ